MTNESLASRITPHWSPVTGFGVQINLECEVTSRRRARQIAREIKRAARGSRAWQEAYDRARHEAKVRRIRGTVEAG